MVIRQRRLSPLLFSFLKDELAWRGDRSCLMKQRAFAFDVEGTLMDCSPQILRCWTGTFSLWGRNIGVRALRVFSGMDGSDMLRGMAPDLSLNERKTGLSAISTHILQWLIQLLKPITQW
jgi:hypothetical protein